MSTSTLKLEPATRLAYRSAVGALAAQGVQVITTSTRRTRAEQQILFTKFMLGESAFPAARPGTSTHELGIAVDAIPKIPGNLPLLVETMTAHGFRWAGRGDRVHFTFQGTPFAAGMGAGCHRVNLPLPEGFELC